MPHDLSRRLRAVRVVTPANTAEVSPQLTVVTLGLVVLEAVEVIVPAGHAGLTGVALRYEGTRIVPFRETEFIVANDYTRTWPLDLWLGAGDLTVVTFNTDDAFPHSHYLHFTVADPEAIESEGGGPILIPLGPGVFEPLPPGADDEALLTAAQRAAVDVTFDEFLVRLQAAFDGFLAQLGGGAIPGTIPGEPPPGTELVTVPAVIGLDQASAEGLILEAFLVPVVTEVIDLAPAGSVFEQSPAAGTTVRGGSSVFITVALAEEAEPPPGAEPPAKVAVPNVIGLVRASAKDVVRAAGFTVTTVFRDEKTGKDDVVVDQQPKAGALRLPGFTVTIFVRRRV